MTSAPDAADDPRDAAAIVERSPLALTWRRLSRDRTSLAALAFLAAVVALALAAPLLAALTGHPPIEQYRAVGLSESGLPVAPGGPFWLGTDHLGRDVLVRLAYGARVSLAVGVLASLAAAGLGLAIGLIAGYVGGAVETGLVWVMDLVMSVPFLLCALALVSVFGPSLLLSVAVIVFFSWASIARVVRAEVSALRRREFVEASRSLGAGPVSIMLRDILPNLTVPFVVYTTMLIPGSIVFEATLSFLGLGVVPPTPSWGGMLADAAANSIYLVAWWLVVVPSTALLLTTLAFNILGDGIQDALDPRPRPRRRRRRDAAAGRTAP